jgi:hypothetical protein
VDQQAAAGGSGTVRYWYARTWGMYIFLGFMALMTAAGIAIAWSLTDALVTGSVGPATRGWDYPLPALGALVAIAGAWSMCWFLRPALVLKAGTVRMKRGALQTRRIPIDEVTGVGLVFQRAPYAGRGTGRQPPGWVLQLWFSVELPARIGIAYMPGLRSAHDPRGWEKCLAAAPALGQPGVRPPFSSRAFDPAAQTDPARLATTHAGRVARDVYDRVLAAQGPSGLLAATQQQKHVSGRTVQGTSIAAFWSPDGEIGRPDR